MVSLKFVSNWQSTLLCFILVLTACSSDCSGVPNQVFVSNWVGDLPKRIVLYRYRKDSGFLHLVKTSHGHLDSDTSSDKKDSSSMLTIDFDNDEEFPADSDYKLVLDKSEYRISKIKPGRTGSGCRPPGGVVNRCQLEFNFGFDFEANCGVPVTGPDR